MNSLIAIAAASCYLDLSASVADDEDEEDDGGDSDDSGSSEPATPKATKTKKVKKMKKVKKGAEKSTKKAAKKTDSSSKNVVRLKDLAKSAKITEAVARKKLRDADVPRGEGRWSWDLGSKALKQARKALGLAA